MGEAPTGPDDGPALRYGDGQRALQDRFDTRRLADRLAETATDDVTGYRSFIESLDTFFLATVDEHGCYWLTVPFKGKVMCFDPSGKQMRSIDLPTDLPTCCEFGGADLDVLYVTTAARSRRHQRQAGGLFAADAGVKGLPAPPFGG